MRTTILGFAPALVAATSVAKSPHDGSAALFWRVSCGSHGLAIDVTVDAQSVYHAEVPICRMARTSGATCQENDGFSFIFTTVRQITFSGYRWANDVVPAGTQLKMDIWEAGAAPDALILGVSVRGPKIALVNTLMIAKPEALSTTEIATGLTITTHPVEPRPRL